MGVMDGSLGTAVMDARAGTAVTGGTQEESRDRAATLETPTTATGAQRAETRTSGLTHGTLRSGDCSQPKQFGFRVV